MKLHLVSLYICDACIDGIGEECHTPGCALWLHRVDLPLDRDAMEIIETIDAYEPVQDRSHDPAN